MNIPAFGPWTEADHTGTKQENAIKAARESKITPTRIDRENQTAEFSGSGKEPYQTSLARCTCAAFKGHAPCKHIYRLAMEIGIIDLPFNTGTPKGELIQTQIDWRDAVEELEKLPDSAQATIMWALRLNDSGEIESGGEDAEALRHSPLFEETGIGSFRAIDNFKQARRTALTYLRRKYEWDTDPLTGDVFPYGSTPREPGGPFYFQDDQITAELTRRGHNRCLKGYRPEPEEKTEQNPDGWKQLELF